MDPQGQRSGTRRLAVVIAAVAVAVLGILVAVPFMPLAVRAPAAPAPAAAPAEDMAKPPAPDRPDPGIAARVNGAVLTLAALDAGLPPDTFGPRLRRGRLARIGRLVYAEKMRQFLDGAGVTADGAAVEARLAVYAEHPPPDPDGCGTYRSLEEFMALEFVTPAEFREMVATDLRLDAYLARCWDEAVAAAGGPEAYAAGQRDRVLRSWAHAAHIFFAWPEDGLHGAPLSAVREQRRAAAEAAYRRLQAGVDFAAVAAEVSEDRETAGAGGDLGPVAAGHLGAEFSRALFALAPGGVSGPVETQAGFHIIRRLPLADGDIAAALAREFRDRTAAEVLAEIDTTARVELFLDPRPDESVDYAPDGL